MDLKLSMKRMTSNMRRTIVRTKKIAMAKKKEFIGIGAITCAALLVTVIVVNTNESAVYSLKMNGTHVAYIQDASIIDELIETNRAKKEKEAGVPVTFKENLISAKEVEKNINEIITASDINSILADDNNYQAEATLIKINEEPVVALKTAEEANAVIENAKRVHLEENSKIINYDIKENLLITKTAVALDQLYTVDDATRLVLTGTTETKSYTVKSGDNNWLIARAHDITVEDINKANPQLDSDVLQIGQELNLITPKPYLTIRVEAETTYTEKIDYGTNYEKTNVLYTGEEKIKTNGVYGEKEIVARIIKENSTEVSREIIGTEIVKEPESQIVLLGTKAIPNSLGTGLLATPTRGTVSSPYGRRWGTLHKGVDIANATGTPIWAADGGVVTFSGWKGGYGYTVMISHGNGIETLYGHNSALLVSKGDVVTKGEIVAKMGATGNVTGTHVHFEVRVNGVAKDPSRYIDY